MLKEDGVPTIFAYNANKQPSKPKASTLGEEAATKKKLCDDAFMHNELVRNFEIEINTKATQIFQSKKQMTPVSTQTELNRKSKTQHQTQKSRYSCTVQCQHILKYFKIF